MHPTSLDDAPASDPAPAPDAVGTDRRTPLALVGPALAGLVLSLTLGTYARTHRPNGFALPTLGFTSVLEVKAWAATIAAVLAVAQLVSALAMWGRLPGQRSTPSWVATVHRWSGTVAFLVSLPVAYHCVWALGYRDTTPRVLVHSLLGCAFYGAIATKLLVLRARRAPSWAVPVVGGLLVVLLVSIWMTSALWFFSTVGARGIR